MANANKLVVLQKIQQEKGILFGSFSTDITKQKKCEKWIEVTELAESLGLVTGKPWQYFRDTLWSNWRKRTLAKRENAKVTGAGGGKEVKYNEMDLLILDILGDHKASVESLAGDDCYQSEETAVSQHQAKSPTSVLPSDVPSTFSDSDEKRNVRKGKRCLTRGSERQSVCLPEEKDEEMKRRKLDLQIRHLELLSYKIKLQALELERKLLLPRSEYTKDLPETNTYSGCK